jgi:peptide/nickel transport system permease protein
MTDVASPPVAPHTVFAALRHNRSAQIGAGLLMLFLVTALFGSWLSPYSLSPSKDEIFQPPSRAHWLGTDDAGVDMLSLIIRGARVSLLVGVASALVAMVIGGTVGVLTGYFGGRIDSILMRVTDYFLVIPDVPLMVVAAALFGRSLQNIILIIALIYWASTARMMGASNARVLLTHVVPQVVPLLLALTVLQVALGIYAETFVTFLGLGDPSAVSWGSILQAASASSAQTNGAWWSVVPPGLCVTLVVVGFTLVGQALEEELNPRLRVGHLSFRHFSLRIREVEHG